MRYPLSAIIAAASLAWVWTPLARADTVTPVYSFEEAPGNPDGFAANGGGVTVTQDTVGTTVGTNSLKTSIVTGATFVGALTTLLRPEIGDPPGLDYVLFDLTIAPGEQFTGTRAVVGVTMFGHSQPPNQQFGLQAQFADTEDLLGKAPGTYRDVRIDLSSATHPTTFATGQSFNDIFGTSGSGPNDLIPSGFQLFFSKSNDAPLTVYIDNVRAGIVPEPSALIGGCCALAGWVLARRRRA
jgi:hypothetical protein